ncbi:hypothetical protein CG747_10425 [Streptomyces sp. CB02959]|nr:hypothetical protein CG747_10425 [Streptomyces sp. CB02959]
MLMPEMRYEIDTEDRVAPGRVLLLTQEPGLVVGTYRPGHASEILCEQLNSVCRHIFRHGLWAQRWGADEGTEPSEHALLKVRFEIRPADAFPKDLVCLPQERPGEFVWLIREHHMSQQACDETNEHLRRAVKAGLWVQRWEERDDV